MKEVTPGQSQTDPRVPPTIWLSSRQYHYFGIAKTDNIILPFLAALAALYLALVSE